MPGEVIEDALAKMEPDIIWVDTDQQALELIDNGSAVFAAVASNNLVRRVSTHTGDRVYSPDSYSVIWHHAIVHMNMLAVPKSDNAQRGLDLLNYLTDPERNLRRSTAMGYAPVRNDQSVLIKERFRDILPVQANLNSPIWGNSRWWRTSGEPLEALFHSYINTYYGEIISSYPDRDTLMVDTASSDALDFYTESSERL